MESINDKDLVFNTINETINNYNTSSNKEELFDASKEAADVIIAHKDDGIESVVKRLCEEYINAVNAVAKLSPGLSTGIMDSKNNISINTYVGRVNEGETSKLIDEDTVFDASSMTKMFTAILMLKEAERNNIDLYKNFSYYSQLLQNIDCQILETMKFGNELRTDGRIDDKSLLREEVARRLLNTKVINRNTFLYSDVPYMLAPLLYGDSIKEASTEYYDKFYKLFRDELSLRHTGYTTKNMTGGIFVPVEEDGITFYESKGFYDPKATILAQKLGFPSGHAGASTNVKDLESLFDKLCNGLLSRESLDNMVKPIQDGKYLVDKDGNYILRNDQRILINKAFGIFINNGVLLSSLIPTCFSDKAFVAEGSSGTYALFDIDNGFEMSRLSNIKSATQIKEINTGTYRYGTKHNYAREHMDTRVIAGTHTIDDGAIVREDGSLMRYMYATHNFNFESRDTLLKLRIAREALYRMNKDLIDNEALTRELDKAFNLKLKGEKKLVL